MRWCIYIDVDEAAVAEVDFEQFRFGFFIAGYADDSATLFVFAVAFHVEQTVECVLFDVNVHLDSVRQTAY